MLDGVLDAPNGVAFIVGRLKLGTLVQFANVPVLRRVARFYIWIFRGTPLLVQLFIVFYGLSRVGIAPDREEKYNFSTPYAFNRTAVLVRGDYDQIHSMEDLKGKRTANTISSNYAALAESYGATVTGVDDLNQTIELLLSGRIDATLNAEVVFADYQRTHPDANIQVVAFSDEPERVAIPVRKGDDSATLLAAINDALAQMDADGTLSRLSVKYFGMDISKEQ